MASYAAARNQCSVFHSILASVFSQASGSNQAVFQFPLRCQGYKQTAKHSEHIMDFKTKFYSQNNKLFFCVGHKGIRWHRFTFSKLFSIVLQPFWWLFIVNASSCGLMMSLGQPFIFISRGDANFRNGQCKPEVDKVKLKVDVSQTRSNQWQALCTALC